MSDELLAVFPTGVILPWYSKSGEIPIGWAICDGSNGTPDMRGRFMKGAASFADVGQSGGSDSHSHTITGRTGNADPGDGWNFDDANRDRTPHVSGMGHSHAISGQTDARPSLPPFVTMLFIMKT